MLLIETGVTLRKSSIILRNRAFKILFCHYQNRFASFFKQLIIIDVNNGGDASYRIR